MVHTGRESLGVMKKPETGGASTLDRLTFMTLRSIKVILKAILKLEG